MVDWDDIARRGCFSSTLQSAIRSIPGGPEIESEDELISLSILSGVKPSAVILARTKFTLDRHVVYPAHLDKEKNQDVMGYPAAVMDFKRFELCYSLSRTPEVLSKAPSGIVDETLLRSQEVLPAAVRFLRSLAVAYRITDVSGLLIYADFIPARLKDKSKEYQILVFDNSGRALHLKPEGYGDEKSP